MLISGDEQAARAIASDALAVKKVGVIMSNQTSSNQRDSGLQVTRVLLVLLLLSAGAESLAQSSSVRTSDMDCGSLENAYGPFDYTDSGDYHEHLPIVERFHFNADVESLKRGQTGELPGGDLDYTLRAFPNHHRALYAMARYQLKFSNKSVPPGANFSAECYFLRAIRFRPEDAQVQLVFGIYLDKRGDEAGALEHFQKAVAIAPQSAEAQYNLGLLYFKSGEYELAREHAVAAYDHGFPLPGLKKKLQGIGKW